MRPFPRLNSALFPDQADKVRLSNLVSSFANLSNKVDELRHAVDLFDYGISKFNVSRIPGRLDVEREKWLHWAQFGARAGAIAIYGFDLGLKNLVKLVEDHSAVKERLNMKAFTQSEEMLDFVFPDAAGVRAHGAHPGEWAGDPKERKKHALKGPLEQSSFIVGSGAGLFLSGNLNGNRFESSYKGKFVSYEVSQLSVNSLDAILQAVFGAFAPITW